MTSTFRWSWPIMLALSLAGQNNVRSQASPDHILLEIEAFDRLGGWVVDQQFMDQMGSPFVLAHGLGVPVKDAFTSVRIPADASYRLWVRTRDWVAPWKAPGAPGRFQVLIDGFPLDTTFGNQKAEWHWQDGGSCQLKRGEVRITLHDLTGFEGRCDAILLTSDASFLPPERGSELSAFRRQTLGLPEQPGTAGNYDFVVVGGGIAGTCAAIAAARLGLTVAFIQDRPVLGGNNSSEVRVWLQGARNVPPWDRIGDVVAELEQVDRAHYGPQNTAHLYEDDKKLAVVADEENIDLYLNHRAQAVERHRGRITAVIATDIYSAERRRLVGRWFADCTGDGCIGALAGADFDLTPKGRLGLCNLWNVADKGVPSPFPRCPWALDLSDKPFPGRDSRPPDTKKLGGWYWESGFDRDPINELEYIRDWNFRAMYGAWDALKNIDRVLPTYRLNWCAHICGKRESRRLLGDVVLTLEDLESGREFPDGSVPTGWKVDLHSPDPRYVKGFEDDPFIARASFGQYRMPYWIPYRCLYSRNVPNLFMGGRDISVTHEALGAVRVMRTGGCMGEIIGMAASICRRHNSDPRQVYKRYWTEMTALMQRGAGRIQGSDLDYINQGVPQRRSSHALNLPKAPGWLGPRVKNLARSASLQVSGSRHPRQQPPELLNDGKKDLKANHTRWLSDSGPVCWVEFAWPTPQVINAARILSGYLDQGGQLIAPLRDFKLQYAVGNEWRDVLEGSGQANPKIDWHARFSVVTTSRVRLWIQSTPDNIARIWEIELYRIP